MDRALYEPGEVAEVPVVPRDAVFVDGLVRRFAFHPERIKAAKPEVDALLRELSIHFQIGDGGGATFLNGCLDKNGEQWGEHRDVEALVALGIGVGSASWVLRDMADALPGGVPFFEVHPEAAR